ncbi:MAG: phosphate ABC transporter permease subunit PstC [Anaerolineales bacterium]|nr:phosphate ABC transporter permease subunit PstC [Anaerolineales bacterium]
MTADISEAQASAGKIARVKPVDDSLKRRPRLGETIIQALLFLAGAISILTTVGLVFVLLEESLKFFLEVPLTQFFFTFEWQPRIGKFGVWPLVSATMMTTTIAMMVALPLGIGAAIYLSEYASARVRSTIKPILEILAGIPTVVYGYFALTFVTPLLRSIFGEDVVQIYNTAAAGLTMGILILPLVSSMSEDALHAVPKSLREASFGLGATKLETSLRIVVPAATSGLAAAVIIAISRAIGETMIVAIAAGAGSNLTLNPFEAAETMTGYIVRISKGDLTYNSVDYLSIYAVAALLFFITLGLNVISQRVVRRFREKY